MIVAFNGRILSATNLRGFGRYTLQLLAHLPAHGIRPLIYSIDSIPPEHLSDLPRDSYEVITGGPRRPLVWDQRHWGHDAVRRGAVVLHAPGNYGLPLRGRVPKVLTLHDAIDYVYYLDHLPLRVRWGRGAMILRWLHGSSRYAADRIITVSEHARGDIISRFGVHPDKLRVTYEAADARFTPASSDNVTAIRQRYQLTHRYVYYIGGWEKRKNVRFLLRAFAAANLTDVDLILAGGGSEELKSLRSTGDELGLGPRLKLIGRVDDADLAPLYTAALAFVYPSEYEGFGLQLCEAMACGTPTLAANATCLPEILGPGGVTFTLTVPDELVAQLKRLAADDTYRNTLSIAAMKRAAEFSWDRCAAQTAAVYRELTA